MLRRAHRLRRSAEFTQVVRHGVRAGGRSVALHSLVRDDAEPTRVGFVVGKSVGNAVVRNRVKRRLRSLMAERLEAVPAHSSVAVRANPPAAAATYDDLGRELDSCVARLARRRVRA